MIRDESARVPFAVVGVLLIIVSTIVTAYLVKTESAQISRGVEEDRERDMNAALTLAVSDMGSALNYAGMYAMSEVGKAPVINVSAGSPREDPDTVDEARIQSLAYRQLSKYIEANYDGSYRYGDYAVCASLIGDCRSIVISPGNMTLYRRFDHPVIGCDWNYTTYYIMSVPVRIALSRAGSDFAYAEERIVRTLITSRYPLLKGLTGEYERRLKGMPMFIDLTAASYAYTWARGYTQYASGHPLNIVDNAHLELIVNGAMLMEQGFEYNSVDPMGLATLVYKCIDSAAHPAEVNNYSVTNNSRKGLPGNRTGEQPKSYAFNASDMIERAYNNVSFGGYAEDTFQGAYTARMYVDIQRDLDYYPRINESKIVEDEIHYDLSWRPGGEHRVATRTFRVYRDNSGGNGYADRVTLSYVLTQCSALRYFREGELDSSSLRLDDPVYEGSCDDVINPLSTALYERDLSFGQKAFRDDNLRDVVRCYEDSFDAYRGQGGFDRILMDIIAERDGWEAKMPASLRWKGYEFTCGPDNRHPIWPEIEADYELADLRRKIDEEVRVTLDPGDYGGSPATMTLAAYRELSRIYNGNYDRYLDRQAYVIDAGRERPVYRSCGSKAIYRVRHAFLEDVRRQLEDAARRSGDEINRTIDMRLNRTGLRSSDLERGAASSTNYLGERFYIPFGLAMKLKSSEEFAGKYPWEESVTLAVEQWPSYLDAGRYTDVETGYTARALKVRNVCLFAFPADFVDETAISDSLAGPMLAGIDAVADSAAETGNETIVAQSNALVERVALGARGELKRTIAASFAGDADWAGCLTEETIGRAVDDAYSRRNDDARAITEGLKDGAIAREITAGLVNDSAQALRGQAGRYAEGYVDEYTAYMSGRIRERVAGAERKAMARVISGLKDGLRDTFRDFSREAACVIAEKGADLALEQAMSRIPSGVPLLPPYGWWATLNVWYIEVEGDVPIFTVYDADNEPVPDPIFGHRATGYTRKYQVVTDQDGNVVGLNEPLRFNASTCTFILVPPGGQGVGDKAGDWDEKSPGFDEPERRP